jgi:uncharacterized protein
MGGVDAAAPISIGSRLNSVADTNEFAGEQVGWLMRRDVCTDEPCVILAYNDRIKDLQRWVRH